MHKKMLARFGKSSQRAGGFYLFGPKTHARKRRSCFDALWARPMQLLPHWHGVFGGLYLPHLRQALYRELLSAEVQADKLLHGDKIQVTQEDFDKDGRPEILVEAPDQNLYFRASHNGGSVFEWDLRKEGINLQNVLTRRQEGYRKQLLDAMWLSMEEPTTGQVKTIHDRDAG